MDEGETMTRNTNRNLYSTTVLNGLVFMTVDLGIVSEKFSNDVTHLFQSESGGVLTKKKRKKVKYCSETLNCWKIQSEKQGLFNLYFYFISATRLT